MTAPAGVPGSFDLLGPLPTGTTVLEASAGTGKTFTIAGLVTRYVAEGHVALDRLLVVTFGRAATQELRERVRDRLLCARAALDDPAAAHGSDDRLLRWLVEVGDDELRLRRQRLGDALASFDSATVVTTHQFCQRVLAGLGTAGDVDPGSTLVQGHDDLVVEVAQDLYLRKWADAEAPPPISVDEAISLAREAVSDGQAGLVPGAAEPGSPADIRVRFACAAREETARRAATLRLVSFDDLLTRLRDALTDPGTGPAACAVLRRRFSVVLVDEFQDTDPVQWEILRTAFHGVATLVLIGDPKQAIYAFRGADVVAYLDAAAVAERRATLAVNWRADPALLAGTQALVRGAALGDARIVAVPVSAAATAPSLLDPASGAPIRLRVLARAGLPASAGGLVLVGAARAAVVADVVAEVAGLLRRDVRVLGADGERRLQSGDIAVLVQLNDQAETVQQALRRAGIAAVRSGTSSVFTTPAAAEWLILLEALAQPHRGGLVRRLALTRLVGWTASDIDAAGEPALDALGLAVRQWVDVLAQRGVAALFETVASTQALAARVLAEPGGERLMTDLRHVAEVLHAAAREGQLGLAALVTWLRRRLADGSRDGSEERSRRLDSDAAAVQVVTVHASKGLEFPVVLVPFAWARYVRDPEVPRFHDEQGHRVRDVGGKTGPVWRSSVAAHRREDAGESLRLLYVALTRARSRLVLWWAPSTTTRDAPLHRLLFTDDVAAGIPDAVAVPAAHAAALAVLQRRAEAAHGAVALEAVGPARGATVGGVIPASPNPLAARHFRRSLDTAWTRTSYSSLTASAHDPVPAVGSEPEVAAKDDEPAPVEVDAVGEVAHAPGAGDDGPLLDVPSPMADLPGGTRFGTLVHAILEDLDTDAADPAAELLARTRAAAERLGSAGTTADLLAEALQPALATPLGPLLDMRPLLGVSGRDRLRELDFELPLAGGDRPGGSVTLGDVVPLLRAHLPVDDPLAAYVDLLAVPGLARQPLRGYLTGSVDLVLRVPGVAPRYVVVDYKTNRLAPREERLTAWHYRQPALAAAMVAAHYPLQALLYTVALHRFLRWRQPGYDPDTHLGGVLYLFLRGMCGPGVVEPDGSIPGVFAWRPPAPLVVVLSDLLAGSAP